MLGAGLAASVGFSAFAAALPKDGIPANLSNKLRADLLSVVANAEPGELIPVSIVMKDRATPEDLAFSGLIADKNARRRAVMDVLKGVARRSQAGVLSTLIEGQGRGEVGREYIHALWITNVIGARVTPGMALKLAAREDVDYLNWDRALPLEDVLPYEVSENQAQPLAVECGVDRMSAPRVWNELGITGRNAVIAVIDTGCCIDHPDLRNQIWTNPGEIANNDIDDDGNGYVDDVHGWSFDGNGSSENISDTFGHGTHVSGTVGGDGANGTQTGMAPDVQIMTTKFWNSFSGELSVWLCHQYALENGAHATTASLGWPHSVNPDRRTWREVVENSIQSGVIVIYAAGNEGCGNPPDNVRTPGDVPDVITVGATDCNDRIASFSSCGPVTWQNIDPWRDCPHPPGCIKPTISAPGVDTTSCRHSPCNGYTNLSGTSMATPHVAGAVALILEAAPGLAHFEVKAILEQTAVDLGSPGNDNTFGYGRVDAYEAVVAAGGSEPQPGACCFDDGSCADLLLLECVNAGGNWNFGTECGTHSCPQPGACCVDDARCEIVLERDCNGSFAGEGTTCRGQCPCDKVKKFRAVCKDNRDIKVVVKFRDNSFDGQTITVMIDAQSFNLGVLDGKAKLFAGPFSGGNHTVALTQPACGLTTTVTCP